MFNKQFYIHRLVRDTSANTTTHEGASIALVDAYLEPAGLTSVAPIEANIGQPYTVFITSLSEIDLRDGFKLVDVSDSSKIYYVTSVIEGFEGENFNYQLAVYKPKPEQIEI